MSEEAQPLTHAETMRFLYGPPTQRHELTEDVLVLLVEVRNEFYHELSTLIAQKLLKCPSPELRAQMTEMLQEQCSVYGSRFIEEYKRLGGTW